ncbi:metallophosphoesterase family protein [Chloroflexota bacterium]
MEYASVFEKDELLVGLLSDTHLLRGNELPQQIRGVFDGVDLILHAGDIYELSVLDELGTIAPVLAAEGDDDYFKKPDERVKEEYQTLIAHKRLWFRHRMPFGFIQTLDAGREDELMEILERQRIETPDIVVFGDTHRAVVKRCGGILFINPGSPTLPQYVSRLGTVGLLTITAGGADARLVQLE